MMKRHKELCSTFTGKACDCGVVAIALRLVEKQIEQTLLVMDIAVDPCFEELVDALKAIHEAKEK